MPMLSLRHGLILAALLLPLASCSCDDGNPAVDPCERVTCNQGQDCVDGLCVDRPEPDGGTGGAGGETGCRTNSDCAFQVEGQLCDLGSGACVECLVAAHCAAGESCTAGSCVVPSCTGDAECGGATPYCLTASNVCVACLGAEHCAADERCDEAGACVSTIIPCDTDAVCLAADPSRPLCLLEDGAGTCVACRGDTDCAAGEGCAAGGRCAPLTCADDAACAGFPGRLRCDPVALACVACLGAGDCAVGEACVASACVPTAGCTADEDCAGDPAGERCDETTGACVVCATDRDCPPGRRCVDQDHCEATDCLFPEDCPAGTLCVAGSCEAGPGCATDADCTFDPRAPRCGDGGLCVSCATGEDCAPGESCTAGACERPVECAVDAACSGGYVCDRGLCSPCRTDEQCPRGECSGGFCSDRDACGSDRDCAEGVCAAGQCAACASALDCRPGLWCEAGSCVEDASCAGDGDCASGRTCQAGLCAAAGCGDDAAEPDDGPSRARAHAANGLPVSRTLCPNDEDWLAFSAAPGAGLDAALLAPPPGLRLSLVYDDAGTGGRVEQEEAGGRVIVRALPAATAGRYFLRIRSIAGASGSYTLTAALQPGGGGCPDGLEPNDARGVARRVVPDTLVSGLTLCGDDDFFSVEVAEGGTLSAYVLPVEGDALIELFTAAGARLATGTATPHGGGGVLAVAGPAGAGGSTYLVKVSQGAVRPERYVLYLATAPDPACAGAPLLLASGADRGRVQGATLGHAADLPGGACGAAGPDAVYLIEVASEGRLLAQLRANHDARLALFDAGCGSELACAPFASGAGAVDLPRLAPGSYALVVGGGFSAAGLFDLAVRLLPAVDPPPNDSCATAEAIDVSGGAGATTGSTLGATAEAAPSCAAPVADVFYSFTLAQPGRAVIDVAADAGVYVALLDAAACSAETACSPAAASHRLDLALPAGDHALAIGSSTGAAVELAVGIALPAPVPNDGCAAATPLAVGATATGDTSWAYDDLSFPLAASCTGYFTGGPEAFHAVTLAAGQQVTATLTPAAGYDAALYVIDGCAAPACLAGSDGAFAGRVEEVAFTAPGAGTYRFVVDGAGTGGAYSLQLR